LLKLKPHETFVVSSLVLKTRDGIEQSLEFSWLCPDGADVVTIVKAGDTNVDVCEFPDAFWSAIHPAIQEIIIRIITDAQMKSDFMVIPSLCISSV
jgi:hypothetical protein